jgi:hypothetical protein
MIHTPEEELSVEVADINCVHIDNMNIFESKQGQILQNLTSKSTSSNYKNARVDIQEGSPLRKTNRKNEENRLTLFKANSAANIIPKGTQWYQARSLGR